MRICVTPYFPIYIYIERERERERENYLILCLIYIYIYIYIPYAYLPRMHEPACMFLNHGMGGLLKTGSNLHLRNSLRGAFRCFLVLASSAANSSKETETSLPDSSLSISACSSLVIIPLLLQAQLHDASFWGLLILRTPKNDAMPWHAMPWHAMQCHGLGCK